MTPLLASHNVGTVALAYAKVIELHAALGLPKLDTLPGCWEHAFRTDARWRMAVNGTAEARRAFQGRVPLASLHVKFERGGYPVACYDPIQGVAPAGVDREIRALLDAELALVKAAAQPEPGAAA